MGKNGIAVTNGVTFGGHIFNTLDPYTDKISVKIFGFLVFHTPLVQGFDGYCKMRKSV